MKKSRTADFAVDLLRWAEAFGRTDLPWQPVAGQKPDPYRVWVSEIMLQQTQVLSVKGYFHRFMRRFPRLEDLAGAHLDEVLALWSGLGYYARARNLHRAAQQIFYDGHGNFPQTAEEWALLPGVGRSTAAAIASICFAQRVAILDGNVRRVLARQLCAPEPWASTALDRRLLQEAQVRLPEQKAQMPLYTQAFMDLGALICLPRRPRCNDCPVTQHCQAYLSDRVLFFPVPRTSRQRPVRSVRWLLVAHAGRIALVKRPPSGIWGGLWSIWELPIELQWPSGARLLSSIRHTFTHFELHVEVRLIRLRGITQKNAIEAMAAQAGQTLVFDAIEQFLTMGLPSPVRRLLASL